jgi:glutamine synthetase
MMNLKEISEILKESGHKKVKLAVVDIDGILRGKVISLEKFLSVAESGMGFCNVVFGWDSGDKSYNNVSFTGWHTGYPDSDAFIDLNTFRGIPWENDLPFFLADFSNSEGKGLPVCPRSLLKTIQKRSLDMGFSPMFSQ